jgi:hypothetical protein
MSVKRSRDRWRGATTGMLVAVALTLATAGGAAHAQQASQVDGAADFRTAPVIGDGVHRDTIATGESVWFTVLYRNDSEIDYEAVLRDEDADADAELQLVTTLVAPNLEDIDSYPDRGSTSYSFGDADAYPWYIRVSLITDGRNGVQHDFELTLQGFLDPQESAAGAGARQPCTQDPDCTLDDDLSRIETTVDDLSSDVVALREQADGFGPDRRAVTDEIAALEQQATQLDAQLAQTEPVRVVPRWAWVLFALGAAGAVALTLVVRWRHRDTEPATPETDAAPLDGPDVIVLDEHHDAAQRGGR